MRNKALLRVFAIGITAVMCTLVVLSAVFPIPSSMAGTNFLSIGTTYKVLANPDWLSGYDYRRQITTDGSTAGNQTDYQMDLRVAKDVFESITYSGSQKYGSNPVLTKGSAGQWDDDWVSMGDFVVDENGYAVQESGNYILFFNGSNGTNRIGRATTSNGYDFTKYGSNPILSEGGTGDLDELAVSVASVIKHSSNSYEMFYIGVDVDYPATNTTHLCRATSTDGLSWTKDTANNPLVSSDSWASCTNMMVPHVIMTSDGGYKYFFEGVKSGENGFRIWGGNSSDGISWTTLNSGNPILIPTAATWDAYSVANPRVREITDGHYLLNYNGCVDNTNKYRLGCATSTDLVNWTKRSENPLVLPGSSGAWDDYRIETFTMLKNDIGAGGNLRFWYYGCPDNEKSEISIGYGWIPQQSIYVSDCQDDFDDIRFTQSDGTAELDHWRENYVSGDYADFSIKCNSIIESPDTTNFYIYYDNSGASSASDGYNTFLFFDDFPGSSINTTKWEGDTGSATVSGGIMTLTSGSAAWKTITATTNIPIGAKFRFYADLPTPASSKFQQFGAKDSATTDIIMFDHSGTTQRICVYKAGSGACQSSSFDTTEYREFQILWQTDEVGFYDNGTEVTNSPLTTDVPTNAMPIELRVHDTATEFDWITVGKYVDPEPTWGTWGSEESYSVEITNTPSSNNFGVLEVNTTSNTVINYFTIENTGNCNVDVTIQGTDVTGGDDTWTLSNTATPGENIYGLYAGLDDADDLFDVIVKKTATYNTLLTNLAESATQDWGLKIYMPTSVTNYDAQQMSGTITLVASAS